MAFFDSLRASVLGPEVQDSGLLRAACGSNVGKKRKNNEDNFYLCGRYMDSDDGGTRGVLTWEQPAFGGDGFFFAVFDGMGGGDFGEVASYTAATSTASFFSRGEGIDQHDVTVSLTEYCREVNEQVYRAGSNLGSWQMGSTLVSAYFLDGRFWVCNLGDSRCYLLRGRQLYQISNDHTDEAEMIANGITGRKPYLEQYFGINPEEMTVEPYIKSFDFAAGDVVLLCSDGLTDMVPVPEIEQVLAYEDDAASAVDTLIRKALAAGGKDNVTVMVCQA